MALSESSDLSGSSNHIKTKNATSMNTATSDSEDMCPICYETLPTLHVTTACGHSFCQECMGNWLTIIQHTR